MNDQLEIKEGVSPESNQVELSAAETAMRASDLPMAEASLLRKGLKWTVGGAFAAVFGALSLWVFVFLLEAFSVLPPPISRVFFKTTIFVAREIRDFQKPAPPCSGSSSVDIFVNDAADGKTQDIAIQGWGYFCRDERTRWYLPNFYRTQGSSDLASPRAPKIEYGAAEVSYSLFPPSTDAFGAAGGWTTEEGLKLVSGYGNYGHGENWNGENSRYGALEIPRPTADEAKKIKDTEGYKAKYWVKAKGLSLLEPNGEYKRLEWEAVTALDEPIEGISGGIWLPAGTRREEVQYRAWVTVNGDYTLRSTSKHVETSLWPGGESAPEVSFRLVDALLAPGESIRVEVRWKDRHGESLADMEAPSKSSVEESSAEASGGTPK